MKNKQVLVFVLNHYEKLSKLLVELGNAGITGTTVINSVGMAQVLSKETDALIGSLRSLFVPEREDNRTLFIVLDEDKVELVKDIIHGVVGSLEKPGTEILFTLPVLYCEGMTENC